MDAFKIKVKNECCQAAMDADRSHIAEIVAVALNSYSIPDTAADDLTQLLTDQLAESTGLTVAALVQRSVANALGDFRAKYQLDDVTSLQLSLQSSLLRPAT